MRDENINQALNNARQELKRVDHLVFVSLKYTRTVDVIKSVVERMISTFDCGIDALNIFLKKKKRIKEHPTNPVSRAELIKERFSSDLKLVEFMDFYLLLRKISRAEYTKAREFRRHVTMTAKLENGTLDLNIDRMYEYFDKAKEFLEYIDGVIHGVKSD